MTIKPFVLLTLLPQRSKQPLAAVHRAGPVCLKKAKQGD